MCGGLWLLAFSVALGAVGLPSPAQAAPDGLTIMQGVERAGRSPGEAVSVRMERKRPDGTLEQRSFRMWTLAEEGKPAHSLLRFDSPAAIAGTALLSIVRSGGKQDSWLYVPALRQVRRVAAADRSDSFVQTDFTIEDLTVGIDPDRRKYSVLAEVGCGKGRRCHQVEDRPLNEAAGRLSGYSRVVLWVDTELHVVHRVDFYDKAGAILKVLRAGGLEEVGPGLWRFRSVLLANVQTGSSTTMLVSGREVGAGVDPSVFSPSALGDG